ncbi:MAG: hypothetical protein HY975_04080 [Candidatus Kerfeldbacteria bacterium]|nr:hypothetical protein [Candidatus Kerfeldbacteria bacterium]
MHLSLLPPHKVTALRLGKTLIVLLAASAFFRLLNDHALLWPTATYTYHPGERGRVISPAQPTSLVKTADANIVWKLTRDAFPFTVVTPYALKDIRIRATLHLGTQSTVYMTAQGQAGGTLSTLVRSRYLDTLEWPHVTDGTTTVWMRPPTASHAVSAYRSVADFRAAPPSPHTIGVVGLDRLAYASIRDYQPETTTQAFGHTFRGTHELYVYAANETLHLTFDKADLNREVGADQALVRVARADTMTSAGTTWLKTVRVSDDGNTTGNGKPGVSQPVVVEIPKAAPGVYHVEIITTGDVLLKHLQTRQRYSAFTGTVVLAEGPTYGTPFTPTTIMTEGQRVGLAPVHEQAKQTVTVAGKNLKLTQVKVEQEVKNLKGVTTVTIPKDDVTVTGDGLLVFDGFRLLPDTARALDINVTPNTAGIDYIVARYTLHSGDVVHVDQTYPFDELRLQGKSAQFSLIAPGVQSGGTIGLTNLRATLHRGAFPWAKISEKVKSLF